ncbi:MAG: FAD-binding oxidoreductase, partial [Haloechinothrix sp.]
MGARHTLNGYADAVSTVRERLSALPPGTTVRLAKQTSNLFRFRAPHDGAGLDVSAFARVLGIDPKGRTADVGGMTTYEDLVDATLPYGLMPCVVPQLKTITLGGAVAGLGIESTSFRNGLPHESVLEMEILTGDGRVVLATPDNEHRDLFFGFPNSYGTLGYALRLRIALDPVRPVVALRHVRFDDAGTCAAALSEVCSSGGVDGVDFVDGTVFAPDECYLTLGTFADSAETLSDYTGQQIYYRAIAERATDNLSVRDYLWRWDTDWFWCSRALGAQHPLVRRLWPRRYLRSDVYRSVVAFDRRHGLTDRVRSWRGQPVEEPVIQDVEVPVDRLAEFLDFFHRDIGIAPIWLCPLRQREPVGWTLYPLDPAVLYVNVGFWSSVPLADGQPQGSHNRM